jgi:hypothetical protein
MKLAAAVLFLMAAGALYAAESHKPIRTISVVGNRTAALCNAECPSPRRYRKQQHALLYLGSAHLRVLESAFSHLKSGKYFVKALSCRHASMTFFVASICYHISANPC